MSSPQPRRTQAERTETSQRALIAAGRRLFGDAGFAAVGTEQVAREAGMTRGALYHQFDDKVELFAAVLDEVEADIEHRMTSAVLSSGSDDTARMLLVGAGAFLDACTEPSIRRIVLLDGPSVLGWDRWRSICLRHSVGLVKSVLGDGIERGLISPVSADALTHVLVGAVDEAAFYISNADDPARARADVDVVLERIADALVVQ